MSKHFVFIIGTRAQLIKVAPVIVEFENKSRQCTLLMTGQHMETMQDLINEFGIRSKQVSVLKSKHAQEHSTIASLLIWAPSAYFGIMARLRELHSSPSETDILVHGDTVSTFLGAVAGRFFGGRVIHLESGLTSGKLFNPFPEEILRRLVFNLTNVAMCPDAFTASHMRNKYKKCTIYETNGNTILDAISLVNPHKDTIHSTDVYFVASLHRFQNIYDQKRLNKLVQIITNTAVKHTIYFVLHPATRKRLMASGHLLTLEKNPNIKLTPRLGYGDFLRLAAGASCILTDGGSNQEELAALGKPTIVMRTATERVDGLGKNAIMEEDINDEVENYLISHSYLNLQSSPIAIKNSPSKIIERILSGDTPIK